MKKTLVALAVAAIATSASAATVYNNDGTQVDVGGRFDVVLGKFGDKQRADLRNNESRVEFKAQHDLGEGFKAIGYARLRFDKFEKGVFEDEEAATTSFGNPVTNKLWLALEKDEIGRVSFGKQNTTGDDVQINDNAYFLGGNNNLFTSGDKVVSFRSANFQLAEGQTFGFGADYAFGEAKKDSESEGLKNAYGASVFYGADFSGLALNLNAGYTVKNNDNGDNTNNATGKKATAWRVASQLGFAGAKFGVEYGQTLNKDADVSKSKDRSLLVAAEYQVLPESRVFAQWKRDSTKYSASKNSDLTNVYLVGADYAFTKNVVTYVQYARANIKKVDNGEVDKYNENLYGVGLRVYF